jgi:hypothetical protein
MSAAAPAALWSAARDSWRRCTFVGFGLVAGLHLLQLALLVFRFEALPNYFVVHDWIGGLGTIVQSTPSLRDILTIAADEWLIEVGHMNYAFGNGISEWSVVLMPAKALIIFVTGWLLALNLALVRRAASRCGLSRRDTGAIPGGVGALLLSVASVTMYWVVCCSSPTWVVGLTMLGLSVSTSLLIEPWGDWLAYAGLALLAGNLAFTANRAAHADRLPLTASSRAA